MRGTPLLTLVRSFASRKGDTKQYLRRQTSDEFASKAREHSYRARSAFKLMEMDDRFKFLKTDSVVVDVGCAPGSWSQVVVERCQLSEKDKKEASESRKGAGYLLGVDLQMVLPLSGADILSGNDVTAPSTQSEMRRLLAGRTVDVVLSDMAPNPTGDSATDHLRLIELCRVVLRLFHPVAQPSSSPDSPVPAPDGDTVAASSSVFSLSPNGVYVCKIWDGVARKEFIRELSSVFRVVKTVKPVACRDSSAEMYLYCSKPLK